MVAANPPPPPGELTESLLAAPVWTDDGVTAAGIPVIDVPLVSVGGGLGSFALVDTLRIAGLQPHEVRVLAAHRDPWLTYQTLVRTSQIPDHERIRSDSASVMDNIWGWPSYALREAWAARGAAAKLAPLWQVATEPILTDYFTPRAGQVYASVQRESARIGWSDLVAQGQVRVVRRRVGGGWFVVHTPPAGTTPTKRLAYRARFVHLAVGYPGVRFLPDLQAYRERTGDRTRVVNAYEPHEHVYEELIRRPGVVVVRGSGIVSSRVLQRLIDDRDRHGARTTILHVFRTYVAGPQGSSPFFRRDGGLGFTYQGFNFAKAAWGGQLKVRVERLEGQARADFVRSMGGTNTPKRRLWQRQLRRGLAEGFYRQVVGEVTDVNPGPDRTVVTGLRTADGTRVELVANVIIDATGLDGEITDHRLLADLLATSGAARNAMGRLDVERTFEVRGTRNDPGRLYASGSMTLGGPYAPVDSFLGLQYAALCIADDLARTGFVPRIGPGRSLRGWWRWARNRPV